MDVNVGPYFGRWRSRSGKLLKQSMESLGFAYIIKRIFRKGDAARIWLDCRAWEENVPLRNWPLDIPGNPSWVNKWNQETCYAKNEAIRSSEISRKSIAYLKEFDSNMIQSRVYRTFLFQLFFQLQMARDISKSVFSQRALNAIVKYNFFSHLGSAVHVSRP